MSVALSQEFVQLSLFEYADDLDDTDSGLPAIAARLKPHRSQQEQDAEGLMERLIDRLDVLAHDRIMQRVVEHYGFSDTEWIQLLQLITHALFPEAFVKPGQELLVEGLVERNRPFAPRSVRALLTLMNEWDRGQKSRLETKRDLT